MKTHLEAILNSYAEVFFLRNRWVGLAFLLATFLQPSSGAAGLLAVLAAYALARFMGTAELFLTSGFYTYNPLLVGLSIGYLFRLTPLTVLLVALAGMAAFILTLALAHVFATYLKLPVLSIPFVLISATTYLASGTYSNLYVQGHYPHGSAELLPWALPLWLTGLLKSTGAVFFMPELLPGLIFLVVILLASRLLFISGILGYLIGGSFLWLLTGSYTQAFSSVNLFNFMLVGMALGTIFLVASPRSWIMALLGVGLATLFLQAVEVFWALYNLPVFTLPFNAITLSIIYALGVVGYPFVPAYVGQTPEETLDTYWTHRMRFQGSWRTLAPPFSGTWTVWQGFEGPWTHQGSWRYALDFVMTDAEGKTYQRDGRALEDYFAYRKPVLSPVRGRVVKVVRHLPDNPIGTVDRKNNWGNLVLLYDIRGFYVELSHFARESIRVKEGDWVERGTLLGLCGNSGYSPQPHIHLQVQATDQIGAATLPFSLASYVSNGSRFVARGVPETHERVAPLLPDNALVQRTSFILDEQFTYLLQRADGSTRTVTLTVRMAPDGTFFLDSGRARLYFGQLEDTFFAYRLEGTEEILRYLFIALPQLPPAYQPGLFWEDMLPTRVSHPGWRGHLHLLLRAFWPSAGTRHVQLTFSQPHRIQTRWQEQTWEVTLHEQRGIARIETPDWTLTLQTYHAHTAD